MWGKLLFKNFAIQIKWQLWKNLNKMRIKCICLPAVVLFFLRLGDYVSLCMEGMCGVCEVFGSFKKKKTLLIYGERGREQEEGQKEREKDSHADSPLSTEPDAGLHRTTLRP